MLNHSRLLKTASVLAVSISLLGLGVVPSQASRNGVEQKNNTFAVGITFDFAGVSQVCSGALIAPKIIATAGHCVFDESGRKVSHYYFTAPGVALDAAIDPSVAQPQIANVYTAPGYVVDAANQKDDVAFIELTLPLAKTGFIRPATAMEVAALAPDQAITGYGFGHVYETKAPYSIYARQYAINWTKPTTTPPSTVQLYSTTASACSGDSGGPITTKTATGEEILIGVLSGAASVVDHCGTAGSDGKYTMQMTVVDTYKSLVPAALLVAPAAPTPVAKTYKATCVKGKVTKYVTGANPKCPSGYKLTKKVPITK